MEGLLLILIGVLIGLFTKDDSFILKCSIGLAIILILMSAGR